MPEGPELHLASAFVNNVGREYIFCGSVEKSEVSTKNPDVTWDVKHYTISAKSRGKEVKLTLTEYLDDEKATCEKTQDTKPKTLDILFRFGMSGKFSFTKSEERPKHSHLNFFTKSDGMVLSFVDYRRFGRWEVGADWSTDRGPCVLQEYLDFRKNVLENIDDPVFKKPICEVMLNQKFFNGIGNYLRAEILFRLRIPPFVSAKSVLEKLVSEDTSSKIKSEDGDFLQLCNQLPREVVNLGGKGYDPDSGTGDLSNFTQWLRCYYNPNMKNMVDHNKRTIWFCGEAGPLKPSDTRQRGMKRSTKKIKGAVKEENVVVTENGESPIKKKRATKQNRKTSERVPAVAAQKGHITRGRLAKAVVEASRMSKTSKAGTPKQVKSTRANRTPKSSTSVKIDGSSKIPKTPKQTKASKLKGGLKQPPESPRTGSRRSSRLKPNLTGGK